MRRAIEKAKEIYAEHGNNLDLICEKLGLEVIEETLDGRLKEVYFGDSIVIKKSLPESEKRELVAHALGHHLMHAGNHLAMQKRIYSFGNYHERQANAFAAYLLIPQDQLENKLAKAVSVNELAQDFDTTEKLINLRLRLKEYYSPKKYAFFGGQDGN